MDKIILLLVGVAVGVILVLLWPGKQPLEPQEAPIQPEPAKPEILIEGADVETQKLFSVPEPALRAAEETKPRCLITYPNAALDLLLSDLPADINVIADSVLARPTIAYSDSSISYAVSQEPPRDLFTPIRARLFVSHPDETVLFILKPPLQTLISSTAQVRPHPLVEYADAGWNGSLTPPSKLLGGKGH